MYTRLVSSLAALCFFAHLWWKVSPFYSFATVQLFRIVTHFWRNRRFFPMHKFIFQSKKSRYDSNKVLAQYHNKNICANIFFRPREDKLFKVSTIFEVQIVLKLLSIFVGLTRIIFEMSFLRQ